MAKKIFVDTGLGRKGWFRKLSPGMKCAWRFLIEECDEAGVWSIDEDTLAFHIGERISVSELMSKINDEEEIRLWKIAKDKLLLPGFIAFQYGSLSPECKPHQKVIRRLETLNLWQIYQTGFDQLWKNSQRVSDRVPERVSGTLEEEEEEERKEEDKKIKGGVGEKREPVRSQAAPLITAAGVAECIAEWKATLAHFKISRNLVPGEDLQIGQAVKNYRAENVCLAFQGARKQKKSKDWDPAHFVNLEKYLSKEAFNRLVNLGAGTASPDDQINWEGFGGVA